MQVKVTDESPVKKTLTVTLPKEKVAEKVEEAYRELKKNARVKGFRKGKAPRSVLERMYKNDVHTDVVGQLISESFADALAEADVKMIGQPSIEPPELKEGEDFSYDAVVEILPEIPDVDITGLTLTRNDYKVSEEEVDNQIELLRRNMGHLKPLEEERPAEKGDFVLIDYEGAEGKTNLPELERTEDFTMELGSGKILKDFDEQLVGMKPGEKKRVKVRFPEDYSSANLAGKEVEFDVYLKEIREQVLPEVNDDLAKDLGEYESLDALKDEIRKNLQAGYDKRADQEVEEQIYRQLLDKVDFEARFRTATWVSRTWAPPRPSWPSATARRPASRCGATCFWTRSWTRKASSFPTRCSTRRWRTWPPA